MDELNIELIRNKLYKVGVVLCCSKLVSRYC